MLIANQAHIRDDRSATWLEEPSVRALTFVWYARHLAQLEKIIMFCNSSHVMYYILCFVLCAKKQKASLFCFCFYNWNYHSPLYFKHFHYIWQVTSVRTRIEMCRDFFVKANLTFFWPKFKIRKDYWLFHSLAYDR